MELTSAFVFPVGDVRDTYEINVTITMVAEGPTQAFVSVVDAIAQAIEVNN